MTEAVIAFFFYRVHSTMLTRLLNRIPGSATGLRVSLGNSVWYSPRSRCQGYKHIPKCVGAVINLRAKKSLRGGDADLNGRGSWANRW